MFNVIDKTTNTVIATFKYDWEARHFATELNWDTGNWGCGRERYYAE